MSLLDFDRPAAAADAARGGRLAVALFGPTSTGKTRLSVDLAARIRQALGVERVVVSADSRQAYSYINIGTSKATREGIRVVRHEVIDVADLAHKLEMEWSDMVRCRRREPCPNTLRGGLLPPTLERGKPFTRDKQRRGLTSVKRALPRR